VLLHKDRNLLSTLQQRPCLQDNPLWRPRRQQILKKDQKNQIGPLHTPYGQLRLHTGMMNLIFKAKGTGWIFECYLSWSAFWIV